MDLLNAPDEGPMGKADLPLAALGPMRVMRSPGTWRWVGALF